MSALVEIHSTVVQVEQMVVHLCMDATILKKDSPEELQQQEILKRKKEEQEKRDAAEAVDVEIEECFLFLEFYCLYGSCYAISKNF